MMQTVAQRIDGDAINHFAHKGKAQKHLGLFTRDTALLHVEQSLLVQLSHSGTVTTFHIVRINLEHRLCVHTGFLGGAQIGVALVGNGVLCVLAHQNTAGKSTYGLIVEHIFIELVAGTVAHTVINQGVVIHMLLLVGNDTTVEVSLGTLARKGHFTTVTGQSVVQSDGIERHVAVGLLVYIQIAEAFVLHMSFL